MLEAQDVALRYGRTLALDGVSLDLAPGEILAIVGESGSGKTSLLNVLAGRLPPSAGRVTYRGQDLATLSPNALRTLHRSQWGFVEQDARAALRMTVSAGGNVAERLMAQGARNYATLRETAARWLDATEIGRDRIDDSPATFSGGMMQRLQIARTLVTDPHLIFMDEPTGGLDAPVQARLLDLIRTLVTRQNIAVILVTHDLAVARLLAQRLIVMRAGRIVESGLTDQVLDDPRHPYTQLLVSSVLTA